MSSRPDRERRGRRWPFWVAALLLVSAPLAYEGRSGILRLAGLGNATEGKNLVLILFDSLRKDHLPAYGYERNTTPCLQELSVEGVVFDQYITQAPWTKPSMASLFTSTYPSNHGVVKEGAGDIPPGLTTLAEVLSRGGYRTAAVMENGYMGFGGYARGFDVYRFHGDEGEEVIADAALEVIDALPGDRPFFLVLFFLNPHYPYRPHDASHFERREGEHVTAWQYDGEIFEADRQVGRVLDALEGRGLLEETIVVFTADHGEDMGQHGEKYHGRTLYDTSVNAPLFISGLGRKGRMGGLVREIDLMPTLMDYLGVGPPEECGGQISGVSVREDIDRLAPETGRPAYSETTFRGADLRSRRSERWKIIEDIKDGRVELYDVVADPGEERDLAGDPDHAAVLEAEKRELAAWAAGQWRAEEGAEAAPVPDDVREKLRGLGYAAD